MIVIDTSIWCDFWYLFAIGSYITKVSIPNSIVLSETLPIFHLIFFRL